MGNETIRAERMGRGRRPDHLVRHDPGPCHVHLTMKPQPLADQELKLRAQIDRLCAQRAELTLIIQGLRSMLPRPSKAAGKRTLNIGELAKREGLL